MSQDKLSLFFETSLRPKSDRAVQRGQSRRRGAALSRRQMPRFLRPFKWLMHMIVLFNSFLRLHRQCGFRVSQARARSRVTSAAVALLLSQTILVD